MPKRGSKEWFDRFQNEIEENHREEGQDFALDAVQGNRHVRRWGLHPGGMVGRQGDLYYKSREIAMGHISPVIKLRLEQLAERNLPVDAYLPFPAQKAIQKNLYASWCDTEDGLESRKRVLQLSKNKEAVERNMKS